MAFESVQMKQLARTGKTSKTRTAGVADVIRKQISTRALAPGEKLPSIRRLAGTLQVSPSTVVEAYETLAAEGLIRSRPGSGFFVVGSLPLSVAEIAPRPDREIDPFWVSRQSLDGGSGVLRPGCGWLPEDWMPVSAIRRSLRGLARRTASLLTDYGEAAGSPALRRHLARQFAAEGLDVGADQILLAGSGSQAIDLVCRYFLHPGDTVLVDDPCYFNFHAVLRAHGARIVSVPMTKNGPDLALFAATLATHRPRLYLFNSAIHNPTGASLSPMVAHRVLTLASEHELTIVEDDIFSVFEPEPSPRLAVLDGLSSVVRIGSFSKSLSASIRCGYVAARREWIEGLIDLQIATNFGGPSPIASEVAADVLVSAGYRRHVASLRSRLAERRREAIAVLEPLGIRPWLDPRGGFYLWCQLPDGRSAVDVARFALQEKVVLAPGDVFSVSQTASDWMRFNVAQMADDRLPSVLKAALKSAPV